MLEFLYKAVTFILAPVIYLKIKLSSKGSAYGDRIKELLGDIPAKDYGCPVWFHTVSVGETMGALPLIKRFHELYPDRKIVVTTSTPTGAALYRNISYVEHLYAPLDSTIAVNRFIDRLKPSAMIIMETELWPNLLARLKKNNVPVILMNARLSDRSASRYSLLGKSFNKYIGDRLTMLICQTNDDRNNFEKLGISSDKLHISGSLKFDIDVNQEKIALGEQFSQRFAPRKILCVASTHEGEDEIALNIFQKVRKNIPGLLLILIPRHPERFDNVYKIAEESGFKTARKTDAEISSDVDVIIGNTMGEMPIYMSASTLVLMAGSLTDIGGHNPLEAIAVNTPVISGPYIRNFKKIFNDLVASNACVVANTENLPNVIISLLNDNNKLTELSRNAISVLNSNKGAIEKTLNLLSEKIN